MTGRSRPADRHVTKTGSHVCQADTVRAVHSSLPPPGRRAVASYGPEMSPVWLSARTDQGLERARTQARRRFWDGTRRGGAADVPARQARGRITGQPLRQVTFAARPVRRAAHVPRRLFDGGAPE